MNGSAFSFSDPNKKKKPSRDWKVNKEEADKAINRTLYLEGKYEDTDGSVRGKENI